MRLIDADALKESIHAHDYVLKDCLNSTDKGMFTVGIMQAIDEQSTINTKYGEWILLSEKIPEIDERVIVITHSYDYHIWDCMSNRGDDYFWEDEVGLYHNRYEAVAWLPLPEVTL